MTSKELNLILVSTFPELDSDYRKQTEWQEGNDTGSHVVFGDVLVPKMLFLIHGKRYDAVKKYFDFLEMLLVGGDDYAVDVVTATVLEAIVFDDIDKTEITPLLGAETLKAWNSFK